MNLSFWLDNKEHKLSLKEKAKNQIQVSLGKKRFDVIVDVLNKDEILLNIDGKVYNTIICSNTTSYSISVNGKSFDIERRSVSQILSGGTVKKQKRDVKTSMPGKIVKILLEEGTEVGEGQAVLILEAMKMQNEIKSPQSGKITRISPKPGDSVETGALLFTVE
jgi:biotin carboxyl carrier protein